MCWAVWDRGAVPCAVGAAGDPGAANTEGVGSPLQSSAVRGEGGEDLVNNFAKGFIHFLSVLFL